MFGNCCNQATIVAARQPLRGLIASSVYGSSVHPQDVASRGARRPRCGSNFVPLKKRGRRESRVRAAPAVSCAKCASRNAHEHTGSAEAIRPSLRNGFTAYAALSPATGSLCHRHRRIEVCRTRLGSKKPPPTWHQQRMPGPHGFAVRCNRRSSARRRIAHGSFANPPCDLLRARRCRVHRISTRVREDRDPPLLSGETGESVSVICPTG